MKKYKILGITLISLTILILLNSCPELFKDVETIYIDNKSDYTIDFFIDDEYETTIAPGIKYKTANYTNVTHTLLCTSGDIQWGPKNIKLTKGESYTWTINNPLEPTPTPEPTPIPQADITINNNSSWTVAISIAGESENTIDPGFSDTYTKDIGNYNLVALPQGTNGNWQININLTDDGYIWNIEMNIELYPAENCRVWNFENTYADHLDNNDWGYVSEFAKIKTDSPKFGSYYLSTNTSAHLRNWNIGTVGKSQVIAVWLRSSNYENPSNSIFKYITKFYNDNNCIAIKLDNTETPHIIYEIKKGNTINEFPHSINFIDNQWHYIGILYNSNSDSLYCLHNTDLYTYTSLTGNWELDSTFDFYLLVQNYNETEFSYDELFYCTDKFIDPQVFVDHYNHNVPWGDEYIP